MFNQFFKDNLKYLDRQGQASNRQYMTKESLKGRALNGIFWKALEVGLVQGVGFLISLLLARILNPDDFGLIGMLTVFFALTTVFVESGFIQALVQKQERTDLDFSTVFYFNLTIAFVCYGILFFIAPSIADFYNSPELALILRVLGLNVIILSFTIVQQARLLINIDFKTSTKVSLVGLLMGGTVGLLLAYNGFGVWALVAQQLITNLFKAIALWCLSRWIPLWAFSLQSLSTMFRFGSRLLLAGLYATILSNIYYIIIGKVYQARELGYYTRAYQLPEIISGSLNSVVNSVTFPLLSSIQNDKERMINAYSKMLTMTAFVVFPVMTLLAVLSDPFVRVALTDKWLPVVPLMYWLCFARMLTPISSINLSILNSIGRSDLYLKVDLIKLPLIVGNMLITLPLGIEAVAIGSTLTTFISYFINAYMPGKLFSYGAFAQICDTFKIICVTIFMAVVVLLTNSLILNPLNQLIVGGVTGILSYILFSLILKIEQVKEVRQVLYYLVKR